MYHNIQCMAYLLLHGLEIVWSEQMETCYYLDIS